MTGQSPGPNGAEVSAPVSWRNEATLATSSSKPLYYWVDRRSEKYFARRPTE